MCSKRAYSVQDYESTINGSRRIHRINILARMMRLKSSLRTIHEVKSGFEYSSSKEIV